VPHENTLRIPCITICSHSFSTT